MDIYHAPDCGGGCDGCGYIAADGLWYPGPCPAEDLPFQFVRAEAGELPFGLVPEPIIADAIKGLSKLSEFPE